MNLPTRLLAVGSLLIASVCSAADAFEGKVSLAMSAGKEKAQVLDYSIKQDFMRMDFNTEGKTFSTIIDVKKLEMMMLMSEEKMYMVMPMKQTMEKAMKEADAKTPDLEKTGRTETILGYKCDEYISKDAKSTTEIWVAEGLGAFMGLGNNNGGGGGMGAMFGGKKKSASGWEEKFKGKPGFPLRVISRDTKNKETFRMEATKVAPGKLPDSLFQPPAGYERFQMPSFGGMLKGGG